MLLRFKMYEYNGTFSQPTANDRTSHRNARINAIYGREKVKKKKKHQTAPHKYQATTQQTYHITSDYFILLSRLFSNENMLKISALTCFFHFNFGVLLSTLKRIQQPDLS